MNLPKVVLHDHLDGGLRPATVLELAAQRGRPVPAQTPEDLATWFFESADSGSLARYLDAFTETIALMQDADSLRRVAREFVVDMATDGVIYAEARWAPQQHLTGGLSAAEAVEAVQVGLVDGMESASLSGTTIIARQILCLMRHLDVPEDVVDLAVNHAPGVVGVDVAGPEDGFPLAPFTNALTRVQAAGIHLTVHAGEAAGPESILDALNLGQSVSDMGCGSLKTATNPGGVRQPSRCCRIRCRWRSAQRRTPRPASAARLPSIRYRRCGLPDLTSR